MADTDFLAPPSLRRTRVLTAVCLGLLFLGGYLLRYLGPPEKEITWLQDRFDGRQSAPTSWTTSGSPDLITVDDGLLLGPEHPDDAQARTATTGRNFTRSFTEIDLTLTADTDAVTAGPPAGRAWLDLRLADGRIHRIDLTPRGDALVVTPRICHAPRCVTDTDFETLAGEYAQPAGTSRWLRVTDDGSTTTFSVDDTPVGSVSTADSSMTGFELGGTWGPGERGRISVSEIAVYGTTRR